MQDLSTYRDKIDVIDEQLVRLLEERMGIVLDVAAFKKANHMAILQAGREEAVLQKVRSLLKNTDFELEVDALFRAVFKASRELQERKIPSASLSEETDASLPSSVSETARLGFQGVAGSFSEEALIAFFGESNQCSNYPNFEDVFLALEKGEIDYGVLPIENSSTGSVNEVYDLLLKYGFAIVGEQSIKIEQHLMGLPGTRLDEIKEVYSHSQGLVQSSEFLKKHSDWHQIPYFNTAVSAKLVKDTGDVSKAAIASRQAAAIYGLEILSPSINNQKDNNTLFIIIGQKPIDTHIANKVSVAFWLKNQPGSLAAMLNLFAENGLNMTKIESRPIKYRPWEYVFYADFDGNLETANMEKTLQQAEEAAEKFRLLGIYKRLEQ